MKPFFRPATLADVAELADTMSTCDKQELWHVYQLSPFDALLESYLASDAYAVEWNGKVIALFGFAGTKGSVGIPWMLSTDDIKRISKSLQRQARVVLADNLKNFTYLANFVWEKNEVHVKWLQWLGFEFSGDTITKNGETFLWFGMRNA